jgi:hypothetical protein
MKGLILGCSISAGTHKLDPSNPLGEIIENQIGWYNFLGISNLVVYSFPGGGYLNYATLLDKIDISKFDFILLQESFEPRFLLTINDDFDLIMSNDVDHYTLKDSCKTLNIRSEKETTDNQLSFSRFAVTYISSINKPCAVFHCRRDTGHYNYGNIKVLRVSPSIDEVIYKNPDYHNEIYMELGPWQQGGQIIGHPTLEGNKAIGELVSKPLQEWLKTI